MPQVSIVRSTEAKPRVFQGVNFDLLAVGEASMVAKMKYRADNLVPFHAHPNEQCGYLLSGRIRLVTHDSITELHPGDTYCVPAGVEHRIEILEAAEEVTFFTPPRPDYL